MKQPTLIDVEVIDSEDVDALGIEDFGKSSVRIMYVDNLKLTAEMNEWAARVKIAKANKQELPSIPPYAAECIISISENITKKHNYHMYSWLDDMVGDAIEDCVRYLHNYDPNAITRSSRPNPYGYISRIVTQAFNNRIEHEKRQDYYKNKSLELIGGVDAFDTEDLMAIGGGDEGADIAKNMITDMIDRAHNYESVQKERRALEKSKMPIKETPHYNLLNFIGESE